MAVSCAAPRRAAASASADGVARPARPSRPAGRTVPRCCPQAACASGPAIARCPARAPARQPRHYSDPGFPGRLGTQRRAGAVWRLGPGPSLADVGRGSLATPPRQTQSQGPAPYPALLHELYKRLAQRAAHPLSQPPASRPPACQCPSSAAPRRLSPISASLFRQCAAGPGAVHARQSAATARARPGPSNASREWRCVNAPAATRQALGEGRSSRLSRGPPRPLSTRKLEGRRERGSRGAVHCMSIWDDNLSDSMSVWDDISRKFPFDEIAKSIPFDKRKGFFIPNAQVIVQFLCEFPAPICRPF